MTPPRRRALDWTLLFTTLALVGTAGFAAGRATAPTDSDTSSSACAEPHALVEEHMEAGAQAAEAWNQERDTGWGRDDLEREHREEARTHFSTAYNVKLQNPECFSAEETAQAQTFLDAITP